MRGSAAFHRNPCRFIGYCAGAPELNGVQQGMRQSTRADARGAGGEWWRGELANGQRPRVAGDAAGGRPDAREAMRQQGIRRMQRTASTRSIEVTASICGQTTQLRAGSASTAVPHSKYRRIAHLLAVASGAAAQAVRFRQPVVGAGPVVVPDRLTAAPDPVRNALTRRVLVQTEDAVGALTMTSSGAGR